MKYRELAEKILEMSEDQQECDVTLFDPWDDEYIPIDGIETVVETDILDAGCLHPILTFDSEAFQLSEKDKSV